MRIDFDDVLPPWTFRGIVWFSVLGIIGLAISVNANVANRSSTSHFTVRIVTELSHMTGVTTAVWSPNGKQVATLSDLFRRVTLWDTDTGVVNREFSIAKGPPGCWSLAFTPDGNSVVTTADPRPIDGQHGSVVFWGLKNRDPSGRYLPGPFPDKAAPYNVATVFAVSPRGERLAVGAESPRDAVVALYQGQDLTPPILLPFQKYKDIATTLAFSPDGQKLALGTISGQLQLFDVDKPNPIWSIPAYGELNLGVKAIAFSGDSRFIATGSGGPLGDRTGPGGRFEPEVNANPLAIWDATTGALVRGLSGSRQKISGLSWTFDGRVVAATQDDDTVRFWSIDTPDSPAVVLRVAGPVSSIEFAPRDLRFVASTNKSAVIGELVFR